MPGTRVAPISVIIPCYNGELTIRAAVESALNQTLHPAEVIVVDDGSSDDSAAIARAAGATVISQANGGLSAARNTGIGVATQPWIAFLDADDLWEPDKLQQQWAAHDLYPQAGLITCDFVKFEGEDLLTSTFLFSPDSGYEQGNRVRIAERVSLIEDMSAFGKTGLFVFPSALLVRKKVVAAAGAFRPDFRIGEDVECFLRWLSRTSLLVVERPLMRYRIHQGNLSKNKTARLLSYVRTADLMAQFPEDYPPGIPDLFASRVNGKLLLAARQSMTVGDSRASRRALRESMRRKVTIRALMLWMLTWMHPSLLSAARTLRASLSPLPSSRSAAP
jgi:glycosyltransferase involved in cell wall biosynthesis